jgi:PAS domain S-box-containing protein
MAPGAKWSGPFRAQHPGGPSQPKVPGRFSSRGGPAISDKPVELIKVENQRLRERVAELEQELAEARKAGASSPQQARLMELLRQKNQQLEAFARENHNKAKEAERVVLELGLRNEELLNSMAVLRLYQLMFENDPNGLLGVAPDGNIIQFNSSAIRFFGYDLHKLRLQHISGLALPGTDVNVEKVFNQAMRDGEAAAVDCRQGDRRVRVSCFRLEDIRGQRGVVFRLSEVRE